MKKILLLLLLASAPAWADNCKVVKVTIENNGIVDNQTATICKDTQVDDRLKVGDVILESEAGAGGLPNYFKHKGHKCRYFTENTILKGKLRDYNGVICQVNDNDANWVVVDKW